MVLGTLEEEQEVMTTLMLRRHSEDEDDVNSVFTDSRHPVDLFAQKLGSIDFTNS